MMRRMKLPALFAVLILLFGTSFAGAADNTAHHRKVYDEVNAGAKSWRKSKATHKDDPIVFELEGWSDAGGLRKILMQVPGEDGGGSEEYYLEDGKLLFVFRHYRGTHPDTGKANAMIEDRFYFNDGKMFKWVAAGKKTISPDEGDFKAEAERLTGNCATFVKALNGKSAAKPKEKAGAVQQAEGTFTGIDDGDYLHWNMKTAQGKELSFFVLQPDAALEKVVAEPGKFVGRKCRVQWKSSVENIPEAGGKMKLEQILSVEWLGKK